MLFRVAKKAVSPMVQSRPSARLDFHSEGLSGVGNADEKILMGRATMTEKHRYEVNKH